MHPAKRKSEQRIQVLKSAHRILALLLLGCAIANFAGYAMGRDIAIGILIAYVGYAVHLQIAHRFVPPMRGAQQLFLAVLTKWLLVGAGFAWAFQHGIKGGAIVGFCVFMAGWFVICARFIR